MLNTQILINQENDLNLQISNLIDEIKRYEEYMHILFGFATGKRKLKHGKHANQVIRYQPEDYIRLGNSLCGIKRQILQLQDKYYALTGKYYEQDA